MKTLDEARLGAGRDGPGGTPAAPAHGSGQGSGEEARIARSSQGAAGLLSPRTASCGTSRRRSANWPRPPGSRTTNWWASSPSVPPRPCNTGTCPRRRTRPNRRSRRAKWTSSSCRRSSSPTRASTTYVKLGLEKNPDMRFVVQISWGGGDIDNQDFPKGASNKVDRNKTPEQLKKLYERNIKAARGPGRRDQQEGGQEGPVPGPQCPGARDPADEDRQQGDARPDQPGSSCSATRSATPRLRWRRLTPTCTTRSSTAKTRWACPCPPC